MCIWLSSSCLKKGAFVPTSLWILLARKADQRSIVRIIEFWCLCSFQIRDAKLSRSLTNEFKSAAHECAHQMVSEARTAFIFILVITKRLAFNISFLPHFFGIEFCHNRRIILEQEAYWHYQKLDYYFFKHLKYIVYSKM